jgi:uncharacterized protein
MRKLFFFLSVIALLASCSREIKEVTETYPDGKPKLVTWYKDVEGVKVKKRQAGYYQSGEERFKGGFENGKPAGEWEFWFENGKTFAEAKYDQKIDKQSWKFWNENGGRILDDSYTVTVQGFYPDLTPSQAVFFKGEGRAATNIFFYPNFKSQMDGASENGKRTGRWVYFYENGNKWSEGFFVNDINDSTRTVWYESGAKRYEGKYKLGIEVGLWKFWDEKGTLVKEINYDTIPLDKRIKQ